MGWIGPGVYDGDPIWDAYEFYIKTLGLPVPDGRSDEQTLEELDPTDLAQRLKEHGGKCLTRMYAEVEHQMYQTPRKNCGPEHTAYVYVLCDFYLRAGLRLPTGLNELRRRMVETEISRAHLHGWDVTEERQQELRTWNSRFEKTT